MTCRRAAQWISRELDQELSLFQQARLGFHTRLCGACRRYRRQLKLVDEVVELFVAASTSKGSTAALPGDQKTHLRDVIASALAKES